MNLKINRETLIEKLKNSLVEEENKFQESLQLEEKRMSLYDERKILMLNMLKSGDFTNLQYKYESYNYSDNTRYLPTIEVEFSKLPDIEPMKSFTSSSSVQNNIDSIKSALTKLEMAENEFITVTEKENYFRFIK